MNDGWMDGATVGSGHAFIDSGGHDSVCQPPYMTTAHPPEWKNFIALGSKYLRQLHPFIACSTLHTRRQWVGICHR